MCSNTDNPTATRIEGLERAAWFARLAFGDMGDLIDDRLGQAREPAAGFEVLP